MTKLCWKGTLFLWFPTSSWSPFSNIWAHCVIWPVIDQGVIQDTFKIGNCFWVHGNRRPNFDKLIKIKSFKVTSATKQLLKMCYLRHRLWIFLFRRKVIFCSQDIQVSVFLAISWFSKSVTSWWVLVHQIGGIFEYIFWTTTH